MKNLNSLFEEHHVFDTSLCFFNYDQNIDNIKSLTECLKNNKIPSNDTEIIWKMKYNKKYDKKLVFEIVMRKTCICALLVFSSLCHKDDKDLYRDLFFSHPDIKNNKDIYNYLYAKTIIQDELVKKTKSKDEFIKALNFINLVDNSLFKSVPYYKYLANYFTGNYDIALSNLIIFLKSLNIYNSEYCEIFIDKLNIIKLYIEINKLDNKDVLKEIIDKINDDKTIRFIRNKLNKSKNNPCINCKNINTSNSISTTISTPTINFYDCNHFYCLECITEKNCTFCKNKFIS